VTGNSHDERGYPTNRPDENEVLIKRLFQKISRDTAKLQLADAYYTEDATVNIIAYGSVARASLRAVKEARAKGMKVGLLKLKVLFPFMRQTVEPLLAKSKKVLVPEMNMGQISREVKRVNESRCIIETLNKVSYEPITPEEIIKKLEAIYE
jgi:2-oxoglutarate ferredoxin oxidoreductase subunit alpha